MKNERGSVTPMDERRRGARVGRVFDDWARRGRAEGMEEGHGRTAAPLLASLPVQGGTRFLDLGCGNGWAARAAAARGADAVGVDASREMVALATRRAHDTGAAATFRVADFGSLPFGDASFDLAWSMEAVYYAADPDRVLREVRRVVVPGGSVHVLLDYYKENAASHPWPVETGLAMDLRSEREWRDALVEAGFTNVASDRLRAVDAGAESWKRDAGTLYVRGGRPDAP